MRIVTDATNLVSIENLYRETGWEKLETRRLKHKLCVFYKMINQLCPNYLCGLLRSDNEPLAYNLRNNDIRTIRCRTDLCQRSFLPSSIREWNNLSNDVKNAHSLSIFKKNLNSDLRKPPCYYLTGKRLGQIYHTRLRLNCSSLRYTLFRKNIISDPSCECGDIESVDHYLLKCNKYGKQRRNYISCLPYHINTNLLLFDDPNLDEICNKNIFTAVQNYIMQTKRFTNE